MEHSNETNGDLNGPDRMYDLLCRYVFGEASEAERTEVEAALASSEELRAQKAELDATVSLVQGAMAKPAAGEAETLSNDRMAALTAAAGAAAPTGDTGGGKVIQGTFGSQAMKLAAAAAILAMAGGAYVLRDSGDQAGPDLAGAESSTDVVAMDAAQVQAPLGAAESLPSAGQPADLRGKAGNSELLDDEVSIVASAPQESKESMDVASVVADSAADLSLAGEAVVHRSMGPLSKAPGGPSSPGPGGPTVAGGVPAGPTSGGPVVMVESKASQVLGETRTEFGAAVNVRRLRESARMKADGAYRGPGDTAPPAKAAPVTDPEGSLAQEIRDIAPTSTAVGGRADRKQSLASSSEDFFMGRGTGERKVDLRQLPDERPRDMFFRFYGDNPYVATQNDKLSTFAADVDTASFSLARRMLKDGYLPTRAQIRTEEFVNFAKPDVAPPTEGTFAVRGELAPSPFGGAEDRWLLRVGIRAKDVARESRPPLALTFVVDTSGSMKENNRLELVKHALRLLVGQLDSRDMISIVGFSSQATEVLGPTPANDTDSIETALFALQPSGSTNAEMGLRLGYDVASRIAPVETAQRRVIFLSDGVANMGQTDQDRIAEDVKRFAEGGIFLNTIGVGMSNHNDVFLEQLANRGDGVCDYVGNAKDARRAIVERFISGFVTVAKNVKIQVEFDGEAVLRYRQLGYENRAVRDADFRNDAVDAGEIGAGHQVTAFYEVQLASGVANGEAPLAKVRLRWKEVDAGDGKTLVLGKTGTIERETALTYGSIVAPSFRGASSGFRRGALAAQLAELLRGSYHARGDSMDVLRKGLANLLLDDPSEDSAAVAECAKLAIDLGLTAPPLPQPNDSDADRRAAYYRSLIESLGGADELKDLGEEVPLLEYEERIRDLIQGDQGDKPH